MEHGYMQEQRGPEDMLGVGLRVLKPHHNALDGYAKMLVDFWPSLEDYNNDKPGFDKHTKSEAEKTVLVHESKEVALAKATGQGQDQ